MRNSSERSFQLIANIVMAVAALVCVIPLVLLVASSFTDNTTLILEGYNFWPKKFSLEAYEYLMEESDQIFHAFGISFFVTALGVVLSVSMTTMLGYALSRPALPFRRFFAFYVFFTMLFNGGLVPTYMMYTGIFHIKNTIWALLVPNLMVRAYYVILVRSYFTNSVPKELMEASYIDGATEFQTFTKVALPLAKPIVTTVALFSGILYWNDWQNGYVYLTTRTDLYSIQNLLNRMIQEIQFLTSAEAGLSFDVSRVPSTTVRMAIAVVGILPIVIIYPFLQKNFAKGITLGAVKG